MHLRQHVISRELPVKINTIKVEVLDKVDSALDEHVSSLCSLCHLTNSIFVYTVTTIKQSEFVVDGFNK